MPLLSVVKNYADNTILTQLQLNQAFESVEQFLNNTKLDAQNIQASAITPTELAADSVTNEKIADAAVDLSKLATEVVNRLTPAGTIIASGAAVTPQGYLYCNGAAVSRTVFQSLFNAIGTAYGNGDVTTTFNVPDLRGYFLRGQNDGTGNDPDAAGRVALISGGATGDAVGSAQDHEQLSHNHSQNAHAHSISDPGHTHIAMAENSAPGADIRLQQDLSNPGSGTSVDITNNANSGIRAAATGVSVVANTATNNAFGGNETRPKNIYVRYYIKT